MAEGTLIVLPSGQLAMRDAGALRDWGRLVALYPGW
jgi:hypothetical protein